MITKITVLIADDRDIILNGLRALLPESFPEVEIGLASCVDELRQKLGQRLWQIVIVDIDMRGADIDLITTIKEMQPRSRILVFSEHPEQQMGVRAIRAGADGYLWKHAHVADLVEAIRRLQSGNRYLSPALADRIADLVVQARDEGVDALSNRELLVLKRIGQGLSSGEIADELHLSVKTISTYRSRTLEKLGLRTTADLVRFALENHLAD